MLQEIGVPRDEVGIRFDKFLAHRFPQLAHSQVCALLRNKKIKLSGKKSSSDARLQDKDVIQIFVDLSNFSGIEEPKPLQIIDRHVIEQLESSIIFEDDCLVVLNKPSGLACQGGSGLRYAIDSLITRIRGLERAKLVHRLDKYTTGALMIAKNSASASRISSLIEDRQVHKKYLAVVIGEMKEKKIDICLSLKSCSVGGEEVMLPSRDGKSACTKIERIACKSGLTLVEAELITGRKHQIRAHLSAIGHPVLGDSKYYLSNRIDPIFEKAKLPFLHAYKLSSKELNLDLVIEPLWDFFAIG